MGTRRPSVNRHSGVITWRKYWDASLAYEHDVKEWTDDLSSGDDSIASVAEEDSSGVTVSGLTNTGTVLEMTVTGCGTAVIKVTTTNGEIFYVPFEWQEKKRGAVRDNWG